MVQKAMHVSIWEILQALERAGNSLHFLETHGGCVRNMYDITEQKVTGLVYWVILFGIFGSYHS